MQAAWCTNDMGQPAILRETMTFVSPLMLWTECLSFEGLSKLYEWSVALIVALVSVDDRVPPQ